MPSEAHLNTWKTYQSAWSDISVGDRRDLLSRSVADDCVYSDPTDHCDGVEALIVHIEGSQKKVPGASFRSDKFLDHHGQSLSDWTMLDGNGSVVAMGTSYARFGADGKLVRMTGFFEPRQS